MEITKRPEKLMSDLEQAKNRLSYMENAVLVAKENLERERREGVPPIEKLQENIDHALAVLEVNKKKIKKNKQICLTRKQEMEKWQTWFCSIEKLEKAEEKIILDNELAWRREEITKKENKIQELYQCESDMEQALICDQVQLEAIKQGVHKLPVQRDPRFLGIVEEVSEIQTQINNINQQLRS